MSKHCKWNHSWAPLRFYNCSLFFNHIYSTTDGEYSVLLIGGRCVFTVIYPFLFCIPLFRLYREENSSSWDQSCRVRVPFLFRSYLFLCWYLLTSLLKHAKPRWWRTHHFGWCRTHWASYCTIVSFVLSPQVYLTLSHSQRSNVCVLAIFTSSKSVWTSIVQLSAPSSRVSTIINAHFIWMLFKCSRPLIL